MLRSHTTQVRVRYAETDQMGVVYHANYLIWMEVGRVELCRSLGLAYRDLEKDDQVLLAVIEANCRYLSPARYDDEISITATIQAANPRLVHFAYEINHAPTGRKLATGETRHLFCGPDLRPRRLPENRYALFGISIKSQLHPLPRP